MLLSGASSSVQNGSGAFQEMDQSALAAKVCKNPGPTRHLNELRAIFAGLALCGLRASRSGPVHVALPVDVLESTVSDGEPAVEADEVVTAPVLADLAAFSQAICAAARPLVIAGPPCRRRHAEGAVGSLRDTGVAVLAMDSPRRLRDPSLGAFAEAVAEADLVVLLG